MLLEKISLYKSKHHPKNKNPTNVWELSGKRDGATTQVFIQLPAMGELKIPTASSVQRSKKTSANT